MKPKGEPRNLRDAIQATLDTPDPDAPMTVNEASMYLGHHQHILSLNDPKLTAEALDDPKVAEATQVLVNRVNEIGDDMRKRQQAFESTRLYRSKRFQRHLAAFRERHNLPPR